MKKSLTLICTALFAICFLFSGSTQSQPKGEILAFVGAKIYPDPFTGPINDGVVLLKDGKIQSIGTRVSVKIPNSSRIIDCSGLVMTAGFWNAHVHFMEPKWAQNAQTPAQQLSQQLREMLTRYGFCYAFDLATLDFLNLVTLRHRIATGEVEGPVIFSAGVPFAPPGGSPFYIAPLRLKELSKAADVTAYVNAQLLSGADAIKLWSASPDGKKVIPMPKELIQAGTAAAHQKKAPVFAHPSNLEGVNIAVNGGVDILAHVAPEDSKDWSQQTIDTMLARHMALIPTLKLYQWELERAGHASENSVLLNTAVQQLSSYNKAGGEILFGTDAGYMSDYSPGEEYVLMAKAGLSFQQILASLTVNPARRFGREKMTGKIAVGMDADLVLLSADPAADIRNLISVKYTVSQGKVIYH